MTLKLQKLVFNRKTVNGRPAAIHVRAKETGPIEDADWRGTNDDVTPVAYPLTMTVGDIADLRITATFTATTPPTGDIFIRAIGTRDTLLGDLVSLRFTPADFGQPKQFRLAGSVLRQASVDRHTVGWSWESSADGRTGWQSFASSEHPVFVIVDQLKAPWGRGHLAGDPHTVVPWREVMALACTWAKGLKRADEVVEAITVAVDKLAGTPIGTTEVVQYQNGGNLCDRKKFSIRDIPLIVKRHPNATTKLNCQDINTTIAMFSTILGCDVRLIKLLPKPPATTIDTNPVKVFGRTRATNEPFEFHEVAARPGGPIDERPVWDACLKVDFDPNPAASPGDFGLPAGLAVRPTARDMGYRRRLLVTGSLNCDIAEVESDGLRYPGELPADGPATPAPDPHHRARRERFAELMADAPVSGPTSQDLLGRFQTWLAGVARQGFRRQVDTGEALVPVSFTPLSAVVTGGSRMTAEILVAESGEQAIDVLLALAANYAGTLTPSKVGDFALQEPGRTVMFVWGPIVAVLSDANEEVDPSSNFSAALQLVENLKLVLEATLSS
jgi:hypothetical protein